MRTRTKVAILATMAMLVAGLIGAAQPVAGCDGCDPCEPPACDEGCTPGFWKQEQHFQYWPVPQDTLVTDIFDVVCLEDDGFLDLDGDGSNDTLLDALNYPGGRGLVGKARNFLRAAVAAYLNTLTMDYGPTWVVVDKVLNALTHDCATGRPGFMRAWQREFDAKNNQYCVFSP